MLALNLGIYILFSLTAHAMQALQICTVQKEEVKQIILMSPYMVIILDRITIFQQMNS